jgi:signal transduction histidine kinase
VTHLAGSTPAVGSARWGIRLVWRGLVQTLVSPDPVPGWRWRSPAQRGQVYIALAMATLTLCTTSVATIHQRPTHLQRPLLLNGVLQHPPLGAGHILLALAVVAPLPLAARYPLLAWRIGWLALLLGPLVTADWSGGWPWGPVQVLVLLGVFCVAGVRQQRQVLWWMWALTLIPWWLWIGRDLVNDNGPVGATIAFTIATIAVDSVGSRRHIKWALAAQTEQTELERARLAVLQERAKIARELHDVVAHHMSLIAVRAETAPYRLSGLSEPVRAEFGSLSDAAREAMADMRRLLGVLRHDEPAGRAPQPQISDLPGLVDAARRAGVSIMLSVPSALDQVPSSVGVCAYRIVQESLSNASQHAPGAAVTVSVRCDGGAVLLRVSNGPGGLTSPAANGHGPGHGLVGMRERVALLGGWLSAGPAPDGGFVVSAVLPLGDAA